MLSETRNNDVSLEVSVKSSHPRLSGFKDSDGYASATSHLQLHHILSRIELSGKNTALNFGIGPHRTSTRKYARKNRFPFEVINSSTKGNSDETTIQKCSMKFQVRMKRFLTFSQVIYLALFLEQMS